jgi:hypothetical protein
MSKNALFLGLVLASIAAGSAQAADQFICGTIKRETHPCRGGSCTDFIIERAEATLGGSAQLLYPKNQEIHELLDENFLKEVSVKGHTDRTDSMYFDVDAVEAVAACAE